MEWKKELEDTGGLGPRESLTSYHEGSKGGIQQLAGIRSREAGAGSIYGGF